MAPRATPAAPAHARRRYFSSIPIPSVDPRRCPYNARRMLAIKFRRIGYLPGRPGRTAAAARTGGARARPASRRRVSPASDIRKIDIFVLHIPISIDGSFADARPEPAGGVDAFPLSPKGSGRPSQGNGWARQPQGEISLQICCRCSDRQLAMQFQIAPGDNLGRRSGNPPNPCARSRAHPRAVANRCTNPRGLWL